MSTTCTQSSDNALVTGTINTLSSMSADGQTIWATTTNFIAPGFSTKINYQFSTNGGTAFPGNGAVVSLSDGVGAPYNWNQTFGSLVQAALVCNSIGTTQTLFFYYYDATVAVSRILYSRTTTNSGSSWGPIVQVSTVVAASIGNVSAHMATTGGNDGVVLDVIWSQQTASAGIIETYIGRSINTATSFLSDVVDPKSGTESFFPQITGSRDGSIGWATMVYNGQVIAFNRVGFGSYDVSPPSFTSSQTDANFPRISCSGDGQTVAVTYFVGVVSFSPPTNRSKPLWCGTTDNAGTAWTETQMSVTGAFSTFVTARVASPATVLDGGHAVVVSGNSLSSGDSNVIYVCWICPDGATNGARQIRYRRRMLGTWDGTSTIASTALDINANFPLQKIEVVCSYNGAVASAIWSDNVTTVGSQDRPVRYIHTYDGGVVFSAASTINTLLDNRRPPEHPLLSSILGNVTNIFYPENTDDINPITFYNAAVWTRKCTVANPNNVMVARDFVPDQNTWNSAGQLVTYTFTLPAFASGDFKLSQFLDQNIMQSVSGPATTGTVFLISVTFPSGVYLGSTTSLPGIGNESGTNLQYLTNSGNLVWSTTEIPSTIVIELIWTTRPGFGTQNFFTVPSGWTFGAQWGGVSTFTTYIGASPSRSSTTQNLLLSEALCVAKGSQVLLENRELVSIEQLRPGDFVLGENDRSIPVCKVIDLNMPTNHFYRLQNDATQLLICKNHPVLVNGSEVMPQEIGEEVILHKAKPIYTLITPARQFVQIEGFLVATWSQAGWDNFLTNDPTGSQLKWSSVV